MSKDILVVVGCTKVKNEYPVQMFAADPSIIASGSHQGSAELHVNVPVGEVIKWRAVPLQISEGIDPKQTSEALDANESGWRVIITAVNLWGPNPEKDLGDAQTYLVGWGTNNGDAEGFHYSKQGTIAFPPGPPPKDGCLWSKEIPVSNQRNYGPFVYCMTQLPDQKTPGPKVAYSFECTVYKNGKLAHKVTWDPYVTVTT